MRPRHVGLALASALVGAACVDLFHSTDFTTLCTINPGACAEDANVIDAAATPPPPAALSLDFCRWSSTEALRRAERACAWVGSCHGALPGSSFGSCMARTLSAYDCALNPVLRPTPEASVILACLAEVISCTDVNRCLFQSDTAPTCGPVSAGTFRACNNVGPERSSVIECGLPEAVNPPVGLESCALEGRSCVAIDKARSICAGATGVNCLGPPRCSGTSAVVCQDYATTSTDLGIDCARVGAGSCVDEDGGVACAPIADAGACSGTPRVTCDDAGIARSCVGGREITVDCSVIGQQCAAAGATAREPLSACRTFDAGASCTDTADTCTGDTLRSCANGRAFELACSTLGLGPCVLPPIERGQNARCGPPR